MSGRTCTICAHAQRSEMEAQIIAGQSLRGISRHFAVSPDALERHSRDHVTQAILQAKEELDTQRGLDIVAQLKYINAATLAILKDAQKDKKQAIALQSVDRICKQLELQAKLIGAIDTPQVNIYVSPEWHHIRTTLITALMPYPDARVAVAGALAGLEVSHASLN